MPWRSTIIEETIAASNRETGAACLLRIPMFPKQGFAREKRWRHRGLRVHFGHSRSSLRLLRIWRHHEHVQPDRKGLVYARVSMLRSLILLTVIVMRSWWHKDNTVLECGSQHLRVILRPGRTNLFVVSILECKMGFRDKFRSALDAAGCSCMMRLMKSIRTFLVTCNFFQ